MTKGRKGLFSFYQPALWEPSPPEVRDEPAIVSFRELVPEITDTGYFTHSLFYYPAKFIPQIPRFCLRAYTTAGDWVIDPFAGSGTVGLEAVLTQRNAILTDINPLLNHIVPVKILFSQKSINVRVLENMLSAMFEDSSFYYRPSWKNLEYWYEPPVLDVLCRYWGWVKSLGDDLYRPIIELSLLKASKYFSYAEHKAPKLFKSRAKKKFLQEVMAGDWESAMKSLIYETAMDACHRLTQLAFVRPQPSSKVIYRGGIDSSDPGAWEDLEIHSYPVQAIITSPPYLQAQEYIRTAKLDLYWLGYTEEEIRTISRLEIPYRPAKEIIHTPSLDQIREQLRRVDLRSILDSYFYYTLSVLENSASYLISGGVLCIFVGSPKIDGMEVETWRIMVEYFTERGYNAEAIYEDKIKNRQLFRNRKNKNPEGMSSEFLVVMRKS